MNNWTRSVFWLIEGLCIAGLILMLYGVLLVSLKTSFYGLVMFCITIGILIRAGRFNEGSKFNTKEIK